jgi:hypothetical protein
MEVPMTVHSRVPRSTERKRVLMNAAIIDPQGTHHVRVVDLNSSGARIVCSRILDVGSDLIFRRGALFIAGRVAWSGRDGAGLEFYREIPVMQIASTFHPVFEAQEAAE